MRKYLFRLKFQKIFINFIFLAIFLFVAGSLNWLSTDIPIIYLAVAFLHAFLHIIGDYTITQLIMTYALPKMKTSKSSERLMFRMELLHIVSFVIIGIICYFFSTNFITYNNFWIFAGIIALVAIIRVVMTRIYTRFIVRFGLPSDKRTKDIDEKFNNLDPKNFDKMRNDINEILEELSNRNEKIRDIMEANREIMDDDEFTSTAMNALMESFDEASAKVEEELRLEREKKKKEDAEYYAFFEEFDKKNEEEDLESGGSEEKK